jgi:hypothetical protein
MKLTKRPGTRTTITLNIEHARRMLGEINYLSFKPATGYQVKNGFVALRTTPFLYPHTVLLKSRGSFLELQVDNEIFLKPLVSHLRKGLWVPLYIGKVLPNHAPDAHELHIHTDQREEYTELLARL